MRTLFHLAGALLLVAALAVAAAADEIITKSGRKFSGKIVGETSTHVQIKTKFGGVVKVAKSDIKEIIAKKSKADKYTERLKKVSRSDPEALWELSVWCRLEGLSKQYRETLKLVIAADTDHAKARKALGHVKHGDRWLSKREHAKLSKAALEQEMKAKGMVKYRGKWISVEERDNLKKGLIKYEGRWVTKAERKKLEAGLVKHEGQWITKEELENREKGLYRVGRKWVTEQEADRFHANWDTAWEVAGSGFTIRSNAPISYVRSQLPIYEKAYKCLQAFCLGGKPEAPIPVWIFARISGYNSVQGMVQTPDAMVPLVGQMYYARHSGSVGAAFKFTQPPAVATYKDQNKLYQYLFGCHGLGEAFIWNVGGIERLNDFWFLLGPGHYYGITQCEQCPFNVNWMSQLLRDQCLPVSTLIGIRELSDNPHFNDRFYAQSALLIYMLLKDPRYAEKFEKVRSEIFKSGHPSQVLKKHFDLKELDASMRALLESGQPIPEAAK